MNRNETYTDLEDEARRETQTGLRIPALTARLIREEAAMEAPRRQVTKITQSDMITIMAEDWRERRLKREARQS